MSKVRWVGLDVHAETIAVAVAEEHGVVREVGVIPNRPEAVRRLVKQLGGPDGLHICYEAGPTGYVLYWQLTALGVACEVIAPTLVPVRAGERVKTDRRDARKLTGSFRAGELTPVWVPDPSHEALRDLVRAREAARRDQLRARHRLGKLLLRLGRRRPEGVRAWTLRHERWLDTLVFAWGAQAATFLDYRAEVAHATNRVERLERALDEAVHAAPAALRAVIEALQALRGIAQVSAATIAVEVGSFRRFRSPRQLMGYSGTVPREHSSGARVRRGAITKTGNAHLRRILVEAAWCYRHRPALGLRLRRRQVGVSAPICEVAWKAQHRLHQRFRRLVGRGKPQGQVVTAIARELLGFIWAIGIMVERQGQQTQAA
jgi:transposase